MQRLLCLLSGMNAGGAESFLMKIYRQLDRAQYQLDFCINVQEKCFYEDEILSLGGRIFRIPAKSEDPKAFKRQLAALVTEEGYDRVLRITSNAMGFWDLKIAKKAGARVTIARSSNSGDGAGWKLKAAHCLGRLLYNGYVDVAIAPSALAARYTFGEKAYRSGRVAFVHNAVDLAVFRYDAAARQAIRRECGIAPTATVIGHVGRFAEQKNHLFLIDVFREIQKKNTNAVLLLVGDGPLKEAVEQKAAACGCRDSVISVGIRADIPALLSAMDAFVFPSFYEGMPNTVIEAQATGLPCVIADTITREADITGLVEYLPLTASPEQWAQCALRRVTSERADPHRQLEKKGYTVQESAREFVRLVFEQTI